MIEIDKKKLRARIDDLTKKELKTLSHMIGGKLSRCTISKEAQAKMQEARRKKMEN